MKRGADLRVPAPGQSRKLALIGTLDHAAGKLIVHRSRTNPYQRGEPRRPRQPRLARPRMASQICARAQRQRSWRDLKRHILARQTFHSVEQLDAVETPLDRLNHERRRNVWHNQQIAAER